MSVITLASILDKSPSIHVRSRDITLLPSTRDVAQYDLEVLPTDEAIHAVYRQENLLDQLLPCARKRAEKVKLSEKHQDLVAAMDVQNLEKTLCTCLPGVINSEKDVQTILQLKFLGPALLGVAVERSSKDACGNLEGSSLSIPPIISSGPCFNNLPIPDGVLVDSPIIADDDLDKQWWLEKTKCILEYKTPNVMEKVVTVPAMGDYDSLIASELEKNEALPFVHPVGTNISSSLSIFDKASIQINSQMYGFDAKYGILSSYEQSVFYYRVKVEDFNVLTYSKAYKYDEITPLHFFAWILLCLEGSDDFKLNNISMKRTQDAIAYNTRRMKKGLNPTVGLITDDTTLGSTYRSSDSSSDTTEGIGGDPNYIPSSQSEQVATNPDPLKTRSHLSHDGNENSLSAYADRTDDSDSVDDRSLSGKSSCSGLNTQRSDESPTPPISTSDSGSGDEGDPKPSLRGESIELEETDDNHRSCRTRTSRTRTFGLSLEEMASYNTGLMDLEFKERVESYEVYDREETDDDVDGSRRAGILESHDGPSKSVSPASEGGVEETVSEEEGHIDVNHIFPIRHGIMKTPEKKSAQKRSQSCRFNSSPFSPRQLGKRQRRSYYNSSSSPKGPAKRKQVSRYHLIDESKLDGSPSACLPLCSKVVREEKQKTTSSKYPKGDRVHYKGGVSRYAIYSKASGKGKEREQRDVELYEEEESEEEVEEEWEEDEEEDGEVNEAMEDNAQN